jgi:integrase
VRRGARRIGERRHFDAQNAWRSEITDPLQEHDLVFCTHGGLPLDPANVRRSFRAMVSRAGLNDQVWKPRELRHSFVSLVSDAGVPWEDILRLVGHRSTTVTESVYRKQVRPVLTRGTEAMDRLFRAPDSSTDRPDDSPGDGSSVKQSVKHQPFGAHRPSQRRSP